MTEAVFGVREWLAFHFPYETCVIRSEVASRGSMGGFHRVVISSKDMRAGPVLRGYGPRGTETKTVPWRLRPA